MPHAKFEGGLEALDRRDASLTDLVAHAAQVLNVDLDRKIVASDETGNHLPASTYSFKEQWVLRWLTRSISQALQPPKDRKSITSTTDALLYPAPWKLMQHLLTVIPTDTAIDILVERKFLSSLDRSVRLFLERDQPHTTPATSDSADAETGERSQKRRRLSPVSSEQRNGGDPLLISLLRLCAHCALLVSPFDTANESVQARLSTSVEECASLLSSSLSLGLRALERTGHEQPVVVEDIRSLLHLWSGKPVAASESARQTELKLFSKQCLPICLRLLGLPKDKYKATATSWSALATDLERLLASSVIVRLRGRFLTKHAVSWKKQRPCLTWAILGPIYRDFMASLGADPPDRGVGSVTMVDFAWKNQAHVLYNLATRLLPKFDLRRKQQEQDWLDCLLLVLSYTCCPQLPQIMLSTTNQVEVQDAPYAPQIINGFDGLQSLAELTVTSRCSPSVQSTSYLAAAIATWNDLKIPWVILGHLVRTHSNLLLPNFGFPTSDFALTEVFGRLERSSVSAQQYQVAKTQVVLPMLQAFSRARALKEFIGVWHEQLQEALRVTISKSDQDTDLRLVTVWQDEDILDSFSQEVGISTSTTITEEVLAKLGTALTELPSRVGSTLDIFAYVAVATALLEAKGRNASSSEHELLRAVVESIASALEKNSDYQGQRWRLWSLLNAIQRAITDLRLPEMLLRADKTSTTEVSLAALLDETAPARAQHRYQECLEKFKVITDEARKSSEFFQTAYIEAVSHLENYIKSNRDRVSGTSGLWNGRSLCIANHEQLASACVGALLCNPASLEARPAFFEATLHAVLRSARSATALGDSQTASTSSESVLRAALLEIGPKAARGVRKTLSEQLTMGTSLSLLSDRFRKLIENFILQDRVPSILRSFATVLFEQLQDETAAIRQPAEVVQYLAIMDYISSQYPTTFTKLEAWATWLKLADRISNSELWAQHGDTFVAYHCLRNILHRLCVAAPESELHQWAEQAFVHLVKIKPSKSKARLPKQLGLLVQTEALLVISGSASSTKAGGLQQLGAAFKDLAASDLRALAKSVGDIESLAKIAIVLESASRMSRQYLPMHDFSEAVVQVQTALREVSDAENTELADLQQIVRLQCASFESSNLTETRDLTETTLRDLNLSGHAATNDDYQQLAQTAIEADNFVQSLSIGDRSTCVRLLDDARISKQVGNLRPFLLAAIVLQSSNEDLEVSPDLKAGLADVACLKGVGHAQDLHQLLLELENANLVINTHPTIVTQAAVDTLLAQLTLVLSGTTAHAVGSSVTPDAVHRRACVIVGSILSRFRRRIADRYHLLLPVLQQLTRCLFFSENVVKRARQPTVIGSDPSSFLRSIPDWLVSASQPLPLASAVEVSRLLSSICNPTVSAAKSSRSRGKINELNDETKRVKAIAGQHLQYLVMDYCRCTLDGDIAPTVKEKLLPGMYTVLDAMNRDLMRAMNSAMDPSSRAIFKTLYDDWTRYGKWDKS